MVQGKICKSRNQLGTCRKNDMRERERELCPEQVLGHFDVRITWEQGVG